MVLYLSDVLALGAFARAAWEIGGGWYRFRAGKNKRVVQLGPFEAVNQALKQATQQGDRSSPDWGSGITGSGHSHVVAGWQALSAEAKAGLVDDLIQIAVLTGQLQDIKAIREGRTTWNSLSNREQGQVLAALDGLKLDGLGPALKAQAADLASKWLWQVTEAVPLLAEEISLSEPCSNELSLLTKTFDKADKAVKDVLASERSRHLATLSDSMAALDMTAATAQIKDLKGVLTSSLASELGPAGVAAASSQLRTTLSALGDLESAGLLPTGVADQAGVREAAKKLSAEIDARVATHREKGEADAQASARASEVAHIVQAASSAEYWQPGTPVNVHKALGKMLCDEFVAANNASEPAGITKLLGEAIQKLVPKVKVSEDAELEARITQLLAALVPASTPASPAKPAATEGEEPVAAPAAPAPSPVAAAAELTGVLRVPAAAKVAPGASDAEAVTHLVTAIFNGVALRGAGVPNGDLSQLVPTIKSKAAEKAEAVKKPLLEKLESSVAAFSAAIASDVIMEKVKQAEADGSDVSSHARLALAAAYLKSVAAGSESVMAENGRRALRLVRPDVEGALLGSEGTAAIATAFQSMDQLSLVKDLSTGLELHSSGLVSTLDRLSTYCANAASAAAATAQEAPVANGHAENGEGEAAAEDGDAAEASTSAPAVDPAVYEKVQKIVSDLTSQGLVLLELSAQESRKLSMLRTAVDGAKASAAGDAVVFNRHLTSLKDLSTQLGPIMSSLETKIAQLEGSRKAAVTDLKSSAVATYKGLQTLLQLENETRAAAVKSLNEIKEVVYGMSPQRASQALETGLANLDGTKEKAEGVMGSIAALPGSEDAVSEIMVLEEQVTRVVTAVRKWADWVRMRELALGATPASAGMADEDAEIGLPAVSELQEMHAEDAQFVDMYEMEGIEEETESDGPEEDEDKVAAASTRSQEDEADAASAQEKALLERINCWTRAGQQLIARGQVAVVMMVGAADAEGKLKCTKDVGLPSTKSPLQLFAERLLKSQQLAAQDILGKGAGVLRPLDWYIVAPKAAHETLKTLLKDNAFFGLQPSQVHFVSGDVSRPALSADLKVCMEAPGRMAKSAPCTGDVFVALRASGHLKSIRRRGCKFLEVHTLEDNVMAKAADPVFIGICSSNNLDAAAKACDPTQLMHVYETFADLISTSKAAEAFGRLVPSLGQYLFSSTWLKQLESVLEEEPLALYRLSPAAAVKPANARAAAASASAANQVAYRMDRHLSDWVTYDMEGCTAGVVVTNADDDFGPVYGAPPVYIPPSPTDAVDRLLLQQTNWVQAAGGLLEDEQEGVVEVSPLVSYHGEGLESLCEGRLVKEAYDQDLQGYLPAADKKVVIPNLALAVPLGALWLGVAALKVVTGK